VPPATPKLRLATISLLLLPTVPSLGQFTLDTLSLSETRIRVFKLPVALAAVLVVHHLSAQNVRPREHTRVLLVGVYDARAGTPIEGADVADLGTGSSGVTPASGMVAFVRDDTTATFVNVRKIGYRSELIAVNVGARDTIPVTVALQAAQTLPTVVTKARVGLRGPADTVRRLELNGFYDRRINTGAPSSAFLTADKIDKLTLVSDASALSGRTFCNSNLYLDGVRVLDVNSMGGSMKLPRSRSFRSQPIDQLVSPSEVLAIEFYRTGDAPVEYNATRPNGAPDCGITLIWTK
jgi:hypothetical protein